MDYFKLSRKIETDLMTSKTIAEVLEIRRKMINRITDIEIMEPIEDVRKWYRKALIEGMTGYNNDDLSMLVFHFLNTVGDHIFAQSDDDDWMDEDRFWSELN